MFDMTVALKEQVTGGYQRDKSLDALTYKFRFGFPLIVTLELTSIIKDLSAMICLKKCPDCKTQNQNENVKGYIWQRLSKHTLYYVVEVSKVEHLTTPHKMFKKIFFVSFEHRIYRKIRI